MYIKTDTALVNLSDKDIEVARLRGTDMHRVAALGPRGGWSPDYETDIGADYTLFEGQELECTEFLAAVTQCIMADVTIVPGDTIGKRIHGRAMEAQS